MNRTITCIIGLAVMLSACTNDEQEARPYVVAEFEKQIYQHVVFQGKNRLYLVASRNLQEDDPAEVYRVDLLSQQKTLLFTAVGFPDKFIVSDDETLISVSVTESSPSGSATRLELFDLIAEKKTVLKTAHEHIRPLAIDGDNKTLLYHIGNNIRKIDLVSGEDVLISNYQNNSNIVSAIHPGTRTILISKAGRYYFMDWDGNVMDNPITHFVPRFFSQDGEKIIGHTLKDVVCYTIATGETEVLLTGSDNEFFALSMSRDQNFVLLAADPRWEFSHDLYVVNTESREKKPLMVTRDDEEGIGFFDHDRQVLFMVTRGQRKIFYGIKVD